MGMSTYRPVLASASSSTGRSSSDFGWVDSVSGTVRPRPLPARPRRHAAAGPWFIAIERGLHGRQAVSCRLNGSFRQENPKWRIEMLHRALLGAVAGAAGNLALEV